MARIPSPLAQGQLKAFTTLMLCCCNLPLSCVSFHSLAVSKHYTVLDGLRFYKKRIVSKRPALPAPTGAEDFSKGPFSCSMAVC